MNIEFKPEIFTTSLTKSLAKSIEVDPITKKKVTILPNKISFYKGKIIESPFDAIDKKWESDLQKFRSSSLPSAKANASPRTRPKNDHKKYRAKSSFKGKSKHKAKMGTQGKIGYKGNFEQKQFRRSLHKSGFRVNRSQHEPGESFFRVRGKVFNTMDEKSEKEKFNFFRTKG